MRPDCRIRPSLLSTSLAAALACGCQPTSVCGPAGKVSGQIVRAESSPGLATQPGQTSPELPQPPYFACRSEAVIVAHVSYATDSARDPNPTGQYKPGKDPRLHAGAENMGRGDEKGEYRVLGIGRGVDRDDCGKTALHACEDAVNEYFTLNRAIRPLDVICRLDENPEYCSVTAK
jgi:hypothetical protein